MKKNILFLIMKFLFLFGVLLSSVLSFATNESLDSDNGLTKSYAPLSKCATPAISPAVGAYANGSLVSITITCSTSGAAIYYTTDGTTPSTSKTRYTGAFNITNTNANTTVKAIATATSYSQSDPASVVYTFTSPVATPTFSPSPGNYTSTQNISLSTGTTGASIRYTLDGTTPTLSSPLYGSSIPISVPTTINAMAVKSGVPNSVVAIGTYNVLLPVSAPTFSVSNGTYTTTQYITITSSTV
jgi:hypothetical protein